MQTLPDLPNADLYAALNIRTGAGVSMVRDEQAVGALNIFTVGEVRRFSEDELTLLKGLADQAALAIANARLFEQVQRDAAEQEQRVAERTRDLATLYDVTTVASESVDLQTTLERSLSRVLRALQCQAGLIQILDEADGPSGEERLRLTAQQGIPPDLAAQLGSLPADGGLMGWVLGHGEPLMVPDMAADPRATPGVRASGFPVYLGAPMRAGGRVLGVLSTFGEAGRQFSVEDVALFASVADHLGGAVENAQLHRRAEEAAVMEERERLARELHDSVTQWLYSLNLFTAAARKMAEAGELDQTKQHLAQMGDTAQQALKEMRLMLYELRPPVLEQAGLMGALRYRLDTVEGRAGVETRLLPDKLIELPAPVEAGLYRIAQEALNNALKHAAATSVTVRIRAEGENVILEVHDNGRGFDPDVAVNQGGMGLHTMRERAEKMGGSLDIFSEAGHGSRIQARVSMGTRGNS